MKTTSDITEYKLENWRGDRTESERMCAEILSLDGYERVDPQSPLGGPDGTKDVLMKYGSQSFLAAIYFPPTRQTPAPIRKKFTEDYAGVAKNKVDGMVFMTNQRLKPAQKAELRKISAPTDTIIYDIEAIRVLLDNPRGYGMRLQHLGVPMTEEDQLSFVTHFMDVVDSLAGKSTDYMKRIALILEAGAPADAYSASVGPDIAATRQSTPTVFGSAVVPSDLLRNVFSTQTLSVDTLRLLHLLITFGEISAQGRGELRSDQVWIGTPDSTAESASYIPPKPGEIRGLLEILLSKWRKEFPRLKEAQHELVIRALASFYHGFVSIHPFLDANGRMANALLELLYWEITNEWLPLRLPDSAILFSALQEAHRGDISLLEELIERALSRPG